MSKIIRVNTRTGSIASEDVKKEYQSFGQRGLIAKIMTDEVKPKADPLGRENKLIIATGIFAGTTLSTAHRMSVGGKSPLTGGIKEANVGGNAAYLLAGHDIKAVIFEDAPAKKSWQILKIDKAGKAELVPADEYAGLGNYDLVAKLHAKYGEGIGVASIGQAGERGYRNSTVQVTDFTTGHPSRAAARGGLGAVMGAKGIKAVVIEAPATRAAFPYVNRDQFAEAAKKVIGIMTAPGPASGFTTVGTIGNVDMTAAMAFLPVHSFSGAFISRDKVQNINGPAFMAKLKDHQVGRLRADEPAEQHAEEEHGDGVHGERLDRPVHEQRQPHRLAALARLDHLGEVDLHHDGVHHEEQADGDGDGDHRRAVDVDRQAVEGLRDARGHLAQQDPAHDAQHHPDRQVALEDARQFPVGRRTRGRLMGCSSILVSRCRHNRLSGYSTKVK